MEGNDENLKNWEPENVDPPFILLGGNYLEGHCIPEILCVVMSYDSRGRNQVISSGKVI